VYIEEGFLIVATEYEVDAHGNSRLRTLADAIHCARSTGDKLKNYHFAKNTTQALVRTMMYWHSLRVSNRDQHVRHCQQALMHCPSDLLRY
jgi:hypothetical protein